MAEEEYDPEIQALIESGRSIGEVSSFAYDTQPSGYDDPSSPLEEEDLNEQVKLKVLWKGPPLEEGKAKWTFGFSIVRPP